MMLNDYLMAAMKNATYRVLEDGSYFGCIPGFDGLWSNARTLEQCRDELLSFNPHQGDISKPLLLQLLKQA